MGKEKKKKRRVKIERATLPVNSNERASSSWFMERKQRGEKRQSGGKKSSIFRLPVCIYYLEFLFFFPDERNPRATVGWKMFVPSRGNTWLLGVVCPDDERVLDSW